MGKRASCPGVGIFGGTFDPVHFGHLRAAQETRELLGLEDFRLLPAGNPPHRPPTGASAEHRLAMLQTAVADCPEFRVDDREIRRGGQSYMVDTLEAVRAEVGDLPVVLVIGQDAASQLDSWHRWRRIFDLAHVAVMRRPDSGFVFSPELEEEIRPRFVSRPARLLERPAGAVIQLEITQLAISSTGIREHLRSGRSPRFLLPDSVIGYIEAQRLYRD